jgi:hypothetical protein
VQARTGEPQVLVIPVPQPGLLTAEGVPFDVHSHPAIAVMSVACLAAYPDWEALARTIAPLAGQRPASGTKQSAGRSPG